MPLTFVWDPRKAASNLRKHGVSFEEATTAFADPLSLTIPDPDHSESEERYVLVGLSNMARLMVVVHAETGETIRIISARSASALERRKYEEA
jgi:uncharacterized DUF497 family protein